MIQTVLITAGLFLFGWGLWLKRPFSVRPVRAGWTPSHVAWVSGGPSRVLETWWLALRAGKWLVPFAESPSLWQVGYADAPSDPWLARALAALPQGKAFTHAEIFKHWSKELGDLHSQLHIGRLVVGLHARKQRHLTALLGAGALLIASFIGTGLWTVVCCAAALGTLLALWWMKVPYLTNAGVELRKQMSTDHRAATLAPTDDDVVLAVALGGTAVLAGTPFNTYAAPGASKTSSSSGCGSSGCGTSAGTWTDASSGSSGSWSTGGGVDGGGHSSGCGSSGGSSGCGGGGCGS